MTPEHRPHAGRAFAELEIGMSAEAEVAWTDDDLDAFGRLTGDDAPVHYDEYHAKSMGMPGRIVFGFLVAAPFSRLLGCELPGPLSVIESFRVDLPRPVQPGDVLRYRVEITQLSPATRTALLAISAADADGNLVLRGRAQCGLVR